MAKVQPIPTTPAPKPKPGLKPLTPAAKGLTSPVSTEPVDPRGAEPQKKDFENDFSYGIAYKMWKEGTPFSEWGKYQKGGEKGKPGGTGERLGRIVWNSPKTLIDFPGASLSIIPQAAVGLGMLAKGAFTPSESTEGQPGWKRALLMFGGANQAVDMTIDSLKNTPQTLVQGVNKLETGKAPVAEFSEVAGNVGLLTGAGSMLARGRLTGLGAKWGESLGCW